MPRRADDAGAAGRAGGARRARAAARAAIAARGRGARRCGLRRRHHPLAVGARAADRPARALRAARRVGSARRSSGSSSAGCTSTSRCPTRTRACAPSRRVVPWLPVLLALSANSPFAEGEDTGRRSERAERAARDADGRDAAGRSAAGTTGRRRPAATPTRRHWDAWPRPEYGTLEVRVMDMQTDVRRSAGFAAIVQALVARCRTTVAGRRTTASCTPAAAHEAARLPPDPRRGRGARRAGPARCSMPRPRRSAEAVLDGPRRGRAPARGRAADGIAAVPPDVAGRTASLSVMAVQTETIQVSGIRCERCVSRLAAALGGPRRPRGGEREPDGPGHAVLGRRAHRPRDAIARELARARLPRARRRLSGRE